MPAILIIIGLVLIIYNYRGIKKEKIHGKGENNSASFKSILKDSKEELNDYKIEIGILRRDIAESLTELQEEIVEIKNNMKLLKNNEKTYENKEVLKNEDPLKKDNKDNNFNYLYEEENNNHIKIDKENNNNLNDINENSEEKETTDVGVISQIDFSKKDDSYKTRNIKDLLEKGLSEDEICRKLSVSKGEVLLVKGLFKK